MRTPINTLWTVLISNIPIGQWIEITTLYQLVEDNYNDFTTDDLAPVTPYNKEPTWHRNLRNALQDRKKKGEILWDGNARYKVDKPYIWRMIKEGINSFKGEASYSDLRNYIKNRWNDVNLKTVNAQIVVLTVNHDSRTHYPENLKPRFTNSNSPYDLLYRTDRGQVVKYNIKEHGVWEIFHLNNGELSIRQTTEGTSNKIYTPGDIVWFKNVTNTDFGSAYLDVTNNEFILHFPNIHKTNVLSPKIDEVILIYQKIHGAASFTHLVTPIDNKLIDETGRTEFKYGRRVKILAMTNVEDAIPISETVWKKVPLSGVTQGNACRIENIKSVNNVDELQLDIWQKFNGHFRPENKNSETLTSSIINELNDTNPELSASEGRSKLVSHIVRERNRKIVTEKKRLAVQNNILICEVCTFSFRKKFGKDFIECHHKIPIGQTGETETSLEDLALVCANCHRMLHTKFDGEFLTIEQLKKQIKNGS